MDEVKYKPVLESLAVIQEELKVPKDKDVVGRDWKFRSLEEINMVVKSILKKEGCILLCTDEIVCVGDRVYVKATAKLIHVATGQSAEAVGFAREPLLTPKSKAGKDMMNEGQLTGSTSSFARKYAVCGLFAIDGSTQLEEVQAEKVQWPFPKDDEMKSLLDLKKEMHEAKTIPDDIMKLLTKFISKGINDNDWDDYRTTLQSLREINENAKSQDPTERDLLNDLILQVRDKNEKNRFIQMVSDGIKIKIITKQVNYCIEKQ